MRTNSKRLAAFILTGMVAMSIASNAHADRRSSLAGNLLIQDQDDVWIYPQRSLDHRNLVSFDFYPGADLGTILGGAERASDTTGLPNGQASMGGGALLLFGQEGFAFGIGSHREDYYGSTPGQFLGVGDLMLYGNSRVSSWGFFGYNPNPVPGATQAASAPIGRDASSAAGVFVEPLQLADVILGFNLGPGSSLGTRLSVGQSSASVNTLSVGREDDDSWNTTVINLVVGYTMKANFELDLNLELGLGFFSDSYATDAQEPNYDDSASIAPSFSLSGRAFIPLRESIKLGVLGLVHINTASFDNEFGGMNTTADSVNFSSTNFFIEAGMGPVYELPDKTTIAAYGTLGFGSSSYDFDNGEESYSTSGLLLPGFKLALEHWLWDWFAFRSGVQSRYYFQFQSREFDNDATPNVSQSATAYQFLWSVGVGLKLGNFELNGTLQTPFVTNGPEFLGGTGSGLFSLLNASYKF